LIDLPTVRFSRPLGWAVSRDNLGLLWTALRRFSTDRDRVRFWRTYLAARGDIQLLRSREAEQEILSSARKCARRVLRNRDRRCWRTNRDFQRLGTPLGYVYGVADVPAQELAALAADPARPIRDFRHRVVKLSHTSVVVDAELPKAAGHLRVAYKQSRPGHWWQRVLGRFRPSRALAGWRLGHALRNRGIAAARPVAVCEGTGAQQGNGYLATEWLAGAENLHLYGWRLAKLDDRRRFLLAGRCLQQLGQLIGRMHAWNVGHGDLKAGNLAVVEHPGTTQVYLIDLDGVRLARRLSPSDRAGNLARMAVSLTLHPWVSRPLLLRFLLAYLRQLPAPRSAWKPLWRDIAKTCRRLIARRQRHGRMVA
jgi:tRNA A-37 threonylcarbamoyl transferase component Bud32